MEIAAFILSVIAGVIGFFFLSEATLGVGILAVAALLGIWARLFQADKHHKKEYARLGAIQNNIAHLQKKAKPSQS